MKHILHFLMTSIVYCARPVYDCSSPCIGEINDIKKQYIFNIESGETSTFLLPEDTKYKIFFARKYTQVNLMMKESKSVEYKNFSDVESEISSMYQILKYNVLSGETTRNTSISITANESVSWQVEIGERTQFTAYQLFFIPLDMMFLHGYYWSKLFYDWIFFVVTFSMTVLTNSLETKNNTTFFYSLLLYSCAGFLASAGSKLYHTIAASLDSRSFDENVLFTISVVCFLIEFFPIFVAMLFSYFVRKKPYISIFSTLFISICILFLGAGYFIGPCFLLLSCIFKYIHVSLCE